MTQRSPLTHWGREDWCNLADRLVTTAMSHATPGHGRIVMPGEPGGLGPDIDGLEELASWWAGGVAAGVDTNCEGTDGVEYVVQTRDRPGQRQSLEFPGGTVEVHESLLAGRLAVDPDQFNAITAAVLRLMQRKDLL